MKIAVIYSYTSFAERRSVILFRFNSNVDILKRLVIRKQHRKTMFALFCISSNADIQRRSGIQSEVLDGGTSNKVGKAGRACSSSQND